MEATGSFGPEAGPSVALTARRWRTRRSAAVAGLLFGLLLIAALVLLRVAVEGVDADAVVRDERRRELIRLGLSLVPFAGIAFLWFIGVVRDQVGRVEDRLFSTVFLGSGLLFLAMLFTGAVITASLLALAGTSAVADAQWEFGREIARALVTVYAMRMAALFTFSVSTVVLRSRAAPRWIAFLGYGVGLLLLVASGAHPWVQLAFPAWVLLLSVALLLVHPHPAEPVNPHPAEPGGAAS